MTPPRTAGYAGTERPALGDLDKCTRCGLCEQACPTYRDLHVEADSPRGRVFLMKQTAQGEAPVDEHLAEHLYVCLGCRACETACPSGVPFGKLLEYGRFQVEEHGALSSRRTGWRIFRALAFKAVFPNPALFRLAMLPAKALQAMPALAASAARLPLPAKLRDALNMIPRRHNGAPSKLPAAAPAEGARRARAGLFTGCVMGSLFGHVNAATLRVLSHNGCDVAVARNQWCCGALNVHAGERELARRMARRNIDAFESAGVEFVIVNSAGCGAVMKEYAELLRDDAAYAAKAAAFARKVRDVSEFLCTLGPRDDMGEIAERVTYQDACHLAHAQRIRQQPRALLSMIPGLQFAELPYAERCCGAAGVYSLTHRAMSQRILAEKIRHLTNTGARTVVTANPGCHMQLQAGLLARGSGMRVRHVVELLDEAYSRFAGRPAGDARNSSASRLAV
jgi:glycolate oxidase iron-sulfur subunit